MPNREEIKRQRRYAKRRIAEGREVGKSHRPMSRKQRAAYQRVIRRSDVAIGPERKPLKKAAKDAVVGALEALLTLGRAVGKVATGPVERIADIERRMKK